MMNAKTSLVAAAAAALLALGSVGAIAAPAADGTNATQSAQREQGRHMNAERWQQKRAERAAALKAKLQLTDAQQPAWDAFQQAMQPTPHARIDREGMAKLTTPERIDRMRALRAQRDAEADRRGDAVKTFYAALTPEQQKVFDAQRMGPDHRGFRNGPKGHPGHRMPHGQSMGGPSAG